MQTADPIRSPASGRLPSRAQPHPTEAATKNARTSHDVPRHRRFARFGREAIVDFFSHPLGIFVACLLTLAYVSVVVTLGMDFKFGGPVVAKY